MTTVRHTETGVPAEWGFPTKGEALNVPTARQGTWTRLAVTWQAAVNFLVPIGYEDESGFHHGEMSAPNSAISLGEKAD
jgi:hypothetical protein